MDKIRIALIGYGYWGPNLLRNALGQPRFDVRCVAERDAARRDKLAAAYPDIALESDGLTAIARDDVDAVIIASPADTHFMLAKAALEQGKHVLAEKPMTTTVADGEALAELAEARGCVLMTDHTFLFTPSVRMIKSLYDDGKLGRLSYVDSTRINLGLFNMEANVLWDLAVHDLAILDFILNEEPVHMTVSSHAHLTEESPDLVHLTTYYPSGTMAHFNLSWLSPVKLRRMVFGGDEQMLIWDDLNNDEKIKIYNSGIKLREESQRHVATAEYRIGDISVPRVPTGEALAGVAAHFAAVIDGREESIMDGRRAVRIIRILERAQALLDENRRQIAAAKQ
ncbi:Gfo/Idh/MocA family protein [Magnetofaba australis]|nr:Gfo/Idh/MocA family oxidoreductase [Magnetofaba australis]